MDEPTASLDPIAESRMYQEIIGMFHEQGMLLVSHRMASAACTDLIMVLEKGKLVQSGKHSTLMSEDGLYREMYHKQACWYSEEGSVTYGEEESATYSEEGSMTEYEEV